MMQCPKCKTTYTDETLRFCLADGASLTAVRGEEPTLLRPVAQNPLRVNIPGDSLAATPVLVKRSSGNLIKILLAILLLGFLALVIAGLAGFFFYYNSGRQEIVAQQATPTPAASPSAMPTPTPDDEKTKLQEELANLQKKVEDQKKAKTITQQPNVPLTTTVTADSPEDGFLALRSQPSSESGSRIAKIPHGATLQIGACGGYVTTKKNNYGRWCRATYGGYYGWIFDKYVIY